MVTWEDSAFGLPHGWQFVCDLPNKPETVRMVSVGWVVRRSKTAIMLAQNVGGIDHLPSGQVSNLINIPISCILSEQVIKL